MAEQICKGCGEPKPLTEEFFHRHKNMKSGFLSKCIECVKAYHRQKYLDDPESYKARAAKSREARPNELREYFRQHHQENKVERNAMMAAWYAANKERHRALSNRWKEENQERYRQLGVDSQQRRRARLAGLPHTLAESEWREALKVFAHCCAYCGCGGLLEKDHFVALVRGGGYTADNIIPACRSCNSSKQQADFAEWYPQQAFYSPEREKKILVYLQRDKFA